MERSVAGEEAPATKQGDDHFATVNVAMVQAVEKPEKEPHFHESYRDGQRKRIYDGLQPDHFFHYEYQLLPSTGKGQQGQVFKTDVVLFGGVVSKIYTEKDNRVVQCWREEREEEENKFGWRHKHTFKVSKPLLLDLYNHILEVRVWNSKTKLSARARYDRPKAFRLPAPSSNKPQHVSDVEDGDAPGERLVRRPSKLPVVSHDRVRAYKGGRGQLKQSSNVSIQAGLSTQSVDSEASGAELGPSLSLSSPREGKTSPIMEEASQGKMMELAVPVTASSDGSARNGNRVLSRRTLRQREAEAAEKAREEREGVVLLRLPLAELFAKHGLITTQLDAPVKDIKGLEVTVSMATPLMPERLLRELNPLTITVTKATGLPDKPVSQEQLRSKCVPVYVKYQFGDCPAHQSKPHPHALSINLNDFHVILLGTFDPSLLVELLRGPPLLVELHDRDRRIVKASHPSLFGRESRDVVIGSHAHSHAYPSRDSKTWDPYGVARFDLSGLLLGQKIIQAKCPVTYGPRSPSPCSSPHSVIVGPSQTSPFPPGDYLGSQCELSIVVELTHPLQLSHVPNTSAPIVASPAPSPQTTPTRSASSKATPTHSKRSPKISSKLKKRKDKREGEGDKSSCPFNRLVYVISSEGKSLVEQLLAAVNSINARALGFEELSEKMCFAALSTYKLTKDQMTSPSCDVITGFHVEDWEQHVVVLEGLRAGGINSLWEQLPHHPSQCNHIIKVFYNSGYAFSSRLYAPLDVDLPHVHLYQPLSELTQQSLLYIKDSLSHKVFRCLMSLNSLAVVEEMADLLRNNLLPTSDEVAALSLQFAQPQRLDSADLSDIRSRSSSAGTVPERPLTPDLRRASRFASRRIRASLDMTNKDYDQHLMERSQRSTTNFVKSNMLSVQATSEENSDLPSSVARRRKKGRQRSLSESAIGQTVHLYSSHTFNSTELAKARVRAKLSPGSRYTYCQDYHSMTVMPIDVQARERAQRLSSERRWRTERGFIFPGMESSLHDNAHSQRPDPARLEDLKQPFVDNLLHANTLEPSVNRLEFSWEKRGNDFERWKAPPTSIGPAPPTTIHLAGESRRRELQEWQDGERERWRERLVVADTAFHTHRTGLSCELGEGPSSQVDRLKGMLKCPPQKYSLKKEGLYFSPTPALSVVHDPKLDTHVNILNVSEEGEEGDGAVPFKGYAPGPDQSQSLKRDRNVIPRHGRGMGGDEEDTELRQLHGRDFRLYYHLPTVLYKRPTSRQLDFEDKQELPLFVNNGPAAGKPLEQLVEQSPA